MDHHVPGPVTSALRRRGYDVLTAADDKAEERDDEISLNAPRNYDVSSLLRIATCSRWLKSGAKNENRTSA